MIILKIIGYSIIGLYGLYLIIGFIFILPEIVWAISILMTAPLKAPKELPPEHVVYIAPLPELIKQIPELLQDWFKSAIFWIILPFLIIKTLLSKESLEKAR